MKVGILRETRHTQDRRTPVTPETALLIKENFPDIDLYIQKSSKRIYSDQDYESVGIPVVKDISHCDLLIGVKEVDSSNLFEGKTYLIFSHVAKKQEYNREFFHELIQKKITLIDYEYLTNTRGRVVAFGFWAGLVGSYYALQGIGQKWLQQSIPNPRECTDQNELYSNLKTLNIPPLKIVLTGGGRVASGALEILQEAGITEISPAEFIEQSYSQAVFTQLNPEDYVIRKDGSFSLSDFFKNPQNYRSSFQKFLSQTDVLIACHFWDHRSPVFFTKDQLQKDDFRIRLIADISCDLNGPIPTTIRATSHDNPWYDIDCQLKEQAPFSSMENISVMSVDNLPTALPCDASRTFARDLYHYVFPALFSHHDPDLLIERATILKNGILTSYFKNLKDF